VANLVAGRQLGQVPICARRRLHERFDRSFPP
jgi:hypothetical protein